MEHLNVLFNEPPLVVSPRLAKLVGLNEAIVIQQLHYWLKKDPKIRDDRAWIYNSYGDWLEQLPFRSVDTVKRTISKLVADGLVIKGDFNKASFDKTSWYSLDYEALEFAVSTAYSISAKCTNGAGQYAPTEQGNLPPPIPETTQRLQTDITKKEKSKKSTGLDTIIGNYTQDEKLAQTLRDFIKMRASIKKSLTDRALEILLIKLDKMADTNEQKIALLEQSIFNSWQSVYPLKEASKSIASGGIDYEAEAAKWRQ